MTTLPNVENLLYQTYKKKSMPDYRKVIYDIEEVYRMKALRSKSSADTAWSKFQKEVDDNGIMSDYIRTQYYCSFDIKGTRFATINRLEELQVIKESFLTGMERYEKLFNRNKQNIYRIGSFDSARYNDMAVFIGGILEVDDTGDVPKYYVYATDFVIINKDERDNGRVISPEVLNQRCSDLCSKYKLDMAIYDSTGQQSDRVYYLHKTNKSRSINTLMIPYNYAGRNKQTMFEKLESKIESVEVTLPNIADNEAGYQEFIKQLSYFKKECVGTKISYQAPQSRGFYDDFVVAWAQLCYLPHYVKKCEDDYVTANLANDADYDIVFSKCSDYDNIKISNSKRITSYGRY